MSIVREEACKAKQCVRCRGLEGFEPWRRCGGLEGAMEVVGCAEDEGFSGGGGHL